MDSLWLQHVGDIHTSEVSPSETLEEAQRNEAAVGKWATGVESPVDACGQETRAGPRHVGCR